RRRAPAELCLRAARSCLSIRSSCTSIWHLQYGTFSMAPSVMAPSDWSPQIRRLQIGLAVLVRLIVLVGKILSIPHHLHDVDGAGSMGNHATSGRTGTDSHHAGHGDGSRNNCRRENNGDLAHLALLSKTSSLRCGAATAKLHGSCHRSSSSGARMRALAISRCALRHTLGCYSLASDVWASAIRESVAV